jgi:hypothetical protein
MRIEALNARENLQEIVEKSLTHALTIREKSPTRVTFDRESNGQQWWSHDLLSCYINDRPNAAVRKFLADSFRYTPRRVRAPIQWLLGTLLTTVPGLQISRKKAFRVDPDLQNADSLLIIPGNQRIRLFDFSTQLTRTYLKNGFSNEAILNEIRIRKSGEIGPFINLTDHNQEEGWLEDNLLTGYTLPRYPEHSKVSSFASQAMTSLLKWQGKSRESLSTAKYCETLTANIQRQSDSLQFEPGIPESWITTLTKVARRVQQCALVQSHGDFQPGNIFIETPSLRVVILDWEYCAPRSQYYDLLVYGLAGRFRKGLHKRLSRFLRTGEIPLPHAISNKFVDTLTRNSSVALYLLEEINWLLEAQNKGAFQLLLPEISEFSETLSRFGENLELLFESP